MSTPADLGNLKTSDWNLLQELLERFEKAWQESDSVNLADYLPPSGASLRPYALHELIKTDLAIRWKRGQFVVLDFYVEKFPELGPLAELPLDLILEEFHVRHLYASHDPPSLEEYERRFPKQFPELKRRVKDHRVEQSTLSSPQGAIEKTAVPGVSLSPAAAPVPAGGEKTLSPQRTILPIGEGFRLVRYLGGGGFAEVWQAESSKGFPVAIKIVHRPLDHEEAQVELRSLAQIKHLSHPYLLQTRDYHLVENRLYIEMDLADKTLSDRLKECLRQGLPGIPVDELLRYFREAAEALDYMHSKQVYHRDIKPKNILLHQGHAKVADFGLARMMQSQRMLFSVTGSGTAAYMPPEAWRGQVHINSDQYSLAVTYVELRRGKLPFASNDIYGMMLEHLEKGPDLESLPPAEREVLLQAMAKDPAQRYPSCLEFVQALERAVEQEKSPPVEVTDLPAGKRTHLGRTNRQTTVVHSTGPESEPALGDPDTHTADTEREWESGRQVVLPVPAGGHPLRWTLLGVLTVLLPLAGVAAFLTLRPSFTLVRPIPLTVAIGEAKKLPIFVERRRFHEPITVTFPDPPPGVTIAAGEILADSVEVMVEVDPEAAVPGTYSLQVRAAAAGQEKEAPVELTITGPAYDLPPGWQRAEGAKRIPIDTEGGRLLFYDRIEVVKEGMRVPFLLIPGKRHGDEATFYIMENKVTVGLYRRFAAQAESLEYPKWQELPGNQEDLNPVLGIPVRDAYEFARWLGGQLPLLVQWDKAAGRFLPADRRGPGPFRPPWDRQVPALLGEIARGLLPGSLPEPALGLVPVGGPAAWYLLALANPPPIAFDREEPIPAGTATHDISPYGCRDMAGNGLELTREVDIGGRIVRVPFPKPANSLTDPRQVILRGGSFKDPTPLTFTHLERPVLSGERMARYEGPSEIIRQTGFRVVLEPLAQR